MRTGGTGEKKKIRWHLLLMIVTIAALLFGFGNIRQARAAGETEIRIPYEQTYTAVNAGTQTDDTFTYRLEPIDGAPAPAEATDGITRFQVSGNTSGELILHIPFAGAGYYRYRISAEPDGKAGYTYEEETYTVTIMVMNASDGSLGMGPMVIQDSSLAKYISIPLKAGYQGTTPPGRPDNPQPTVTPVPDPEDPDEPQPTVTPTPGNPVQPVTPTPDNPVQPDTPEPNNPVRPDTPEQNNPVRPDTPATGQEPRGTGTPVPGNTTAGNDGSGEPVRTAVPVPGGEPQETGQPEQAAAVNPEEEPEGPEVSRLEDGEVPLTAIELEDGETKTPDKPQEVWALWNLICMIGSAAIGILLLILFLKGEKTEQTEQKTDAKPADASKQQEENRRCRRKVRLAGLIPAAIAVILFFLTENISHTMAWTDKWTVWMIILLIAEAVIAFVSRKPKKKDEKK